jgi:hypothetical protein
MKELKTIMRFRVKRTPQIITSSKIIFFFKTYISYVLGPSWDIPG